MTGYEREWTYEREWMAERDRPSLTRLRAGCTKRNGQPVDFRLQLEYRHAGEWLAVARSEHDVDGPDYQNAEESGIHIDIHKPDGSQFAKLTGFPDEPSNEAMGRAENFLRRNADDYVRRFERWL